MASVIDIFNICKHLRNGAIRFKMELDLIEKHTVYSCSSSTLNEANIKRIFDKSTLLLQTIYTHPNSHLCYSFVYYIQPT